MRCGTTPIRVIRHERVNSIGNSTCLSQFCKFVERDMLIVPTARYWVSNVWKLWKYKSCWAGLFFELTSLSVGLRSLACWVCGFESHRGHGYLSVVSFCVMSGRGLCDELVTRPEESYRLWCVVVCGLETLRMRRSLPTTGCRAKTNTHQTDVFVSLQTAEKFETQ